MVKIHVSTFITFLFFLCLGSIFVLWSFKYRVPMIIRLLVLFFLNLIKLLVLVFFFNNLCASFVSLWPCVGWWRKALCSYGTGVCVSWKGKHYPVFFRLIRTGTVNVLFNYYWLFINIESLSYCNCINQCTNLVAALFALQMFFIFVTLWLCSLWEGCPCCFNVDSKSVWSWAADWVEVMTWLLFQFFEEIMLYFLFLFSYSTPL